MLLLGAGLASGFPVMLGLIGEMYKENSGTAFSFTMLIALVGNTLINYATGIITNTFGMQAFIYVVISVVVFMALIYVLINKIENK